MMETGRVVCFDVRGSVGEANLAGEACAEGERGRSWLFRRYTRHRVNEC